MFNLFRNTKTRETIERLYGAIVAQSRRTDFYTDFAVPDTMDGRLEMLMLHTVLVCRRLKGGSEIERALSQDIFDAFAADMDRTMREIGVGDLTVPKKMKKIGAAFYGRAAAYDSALAAEGEDALAQAVTRNIFTLGEAAPPPGARALAAYARAAAAELAATPFEVLARGELPLTAPAAPGPLARENR
ncbi:ubiquinol-cytochrome C chaperone family protein [Xanthobacter autotrophicus DSM 431]|uniref:ubiquinol-cytochrome C chaperone family protein n=1 Tax=Xanthobacter nonsaccharivorans TaxID=3119912 RepID=UPI00372AFF76